MKYALDPELKKIARLKLPATLKLFPPMNLILGMSKCRSDTQVRVSQYRTPRISRRPAANAGHRAEAFRG